MKHFFTALAAALFTAHSASQTLETKIHHPMKLNAGIVTSKLEETKKFYTTTLNFGVTFENDFYLLLYTPGNTAELSFLLPDHPGQQALFHKPFTGQGMYLTLEVDDVDKIYKELKNKNVEIKIDLRDEAWGDRHFAIQDPNGIGIDIVRYKPAGEKPPAEVQADKVTWFSIPADNLERAAAFYKEAFNWQIEPLTKEANDDLSFYVAVNSKSDENYISEERGTLNGCLVKRKIGLPSPAVLVEVKDLDAAITKVKRAGGQIVTARTLMKSLNGYFVLVKDSEDNYVELFQNAGS